MYTAIYTTAMNGRPENWKIITEKQYLIERTDYLWDRTNRVIGNGLTYSEAEMVLERAVYADENRFLQWNWEYLNGSFPPFESSDAGYDYRNQ